MKMRTITVLLALSIVGGASAIALSEPIEGTVTGNNVNVRSGPGVRDDFYPVCRLGRGAKVRIVGKVGNFYKIRPIKGSYAIVKASTIDADFNGKTGTVNTSSVRVRAAGKLRQRNLTRTMCTLKRGDRVNIVTLSRDGKWYVIAPPSDAVLYISKDLVKTAAGSTHGGNTDRPDDAGDTYRPRPRPRPRPKTIEETTPAEELADLKALRELQKRITFEDRKNKSKRNYEKIITDANTVKLSKDSRFKEAYEMLIDLARDKQVEANRIREAFRIINETPEQTEQQQGSTPADKNKYKMTGLLRVSYAYSLPNGNPFYMVLDPTTKRRIGYVEDATPLGELSKHVGQIVSLAGKNYFNDRFALNVLKVTALKAGKTSEPGEKKGQPEPGEKKGQPEPGEKKGQPEPGEKKGQPEPGEKKGQPEPGEKKGQPEPGEKKGQPESGEKKGQPEPGEKKGQPDQIPHVEGDKKMGSDNIKELGTHPMSGSGKPFPVDTKLKLGMKPNPVTPTREVEFD